MAQTVVAHLLFVCLFLTFQETFISGQVDDFLRAEYDQNKLPEYPGLQVYRQLETILNDKVKDESVEANLAYLDKVSTKFSDADVKPSALIDAVKLFMALKFVVDEKRCDSLAARAWMANLRALLKGSKKLARLDALIRHQFELIVATCTPLVEKNLQEAIQTIPDHSYTNLTAYLSDEFISQWSDRANYEPGAGVQWKKMNPDLNWSKEPLTLQELMLRQLFRVMGDRKQPLGEYRVKETGEKWPIMLHPEVLKGHLDRNLVRPCTGYVNETSPKALWLIYQVARYEGEQWLDEFLNERSHQFLADLFRFEFCHLDGQTVGTQLWKFYFHTAKEREAVEIEPGESVEHATSVDDDDFIECSEII